LKKNVQTFIKDEIVSVLTDILTSVVTKIGCIVPVYCFMPDHQHLIITWTCSDSDIWKAIVSYKQKTGFWMSMNKTGIRFNPIRKGLSVIVARL